MNALAPLSHISQAITKFRINVVMSLEDEVDYSERETSFPEQKHQENIIYSTYTSPEQRSEPEILIDQPPQSSLDYNTSSNDDSFSLFDSTPSFNTCAEDDSFSTLDSTNSSKTTKRGISPRNRARRDRRQRREKILKEAYWNSHVQSI